MSEVDLRVIIDGRPGGMEEIEALLRPGEETMLMLSVPGCAPCASMKALLDEAGTFSGPMAMRRDVTFEGGSHRDDRVTAMLGKPLTMFPSVLFRSPDGDHHWLRGSGDKQGAWTAERITVWISRCRRRIGKDPIRSSIE